GSGQRLPDLEDLLEESEVARETLIELLERRKTRGDRRLDIPGRPKEQRETVLRAAKIESQLHETPQKDHWIGIRIQLAADLEECLKPSRALGKKGLNLFFCDFFVAGEKAAEGKPVFILQRDLLDAGPVHVRPVLAPQIHQEPVVARPVEKRVPRRHARIPEQEIARGIPPDEMILSFAEDEVATGSLVRKKAEPRGHRTPSL